MNEQEKEQARKGLTLVVAALMQAFNPAQDPATTFDRAEQFAEEAEKRGISIPAIVEGVTP